jgi:hypothetical protein
MSNTEWRPDGITTSPDGCAGTLGSPRTLKSVRTIFHYVRTDAILNCLKLLDTNGRPDGKFSSATFRATTLSSGKRLFFRYWMISVAHSGSTGTASNSITSKFCEIGGLARTITSWPEASISYLLTETNFESSSTVVFASLSTFVITTLSKQDWSLRTLLIIVDF